MKYPIEYFDLTSKFALKVADVKSIDIKEALTFYTDIRRRFYIQGELSVDNPQVIEFFNKYFDSKNIAGSMRKFHIIQKRKYRKEDLNKKYFGVFTFDYNKESKVVQLHTSVDTVKKGETSAFSHEHLNKTRSDIKQMFEYIKSVHPDAKEVFIYSWIVNIQAFKRLFFNGFGEENVEVFWNFTGQSIWGQFMNKYQQVKLDKKQEFLDCIASKNSYDDVLNCFEYKPVRCTYAIEKFHQEYCVY